MATTYYHADALGSTRQLTDASQNVSDTYTYDAFGNQRATSGSSVNPFRYVGQLGYYYDPDTGTMNVRARTYQTGISRWLSRDPLRSEWNLFRYVGNSPGNWGDPSGLTTGEEMAFFHINTGLREYDFVVNWDRTVTCNSGTMSVGQPRNVQIETKERFMGPWYDPLQVGAYLTFGFKFDPDVTISSIKIRTCPGGRGVIADVDYLVQIYVGPSALGIGLGRARWWRTVPDSLPAQHIIVSYSCCPCDDTPAPAFEWGDNPQDWDWNPEDGDIYRPQPHLPQRRNDPWEPE